MRNLLLVVYSAAAVALTLTKIPPMPDIDQITTDEVSVETIFSVKFFFIFLGYIFADQNEHDLPKQLFYLTYWVAGRVYKWRVSG